MTQQQKQPKTIVGMGLTGLSCAHYFAACDIAFRVVDSREVPPLLAEFETAFPQVEKLCGPFTTETFSATDELIVSPGMALNEPAIKQALQDGAGLGSDIEIFINAIDKPIVAITGSNGKSTVTTLVGEMLEAAGYEVCVAGNIGLPVLEQLLDDVDYDVYVLELSSFQLERLQQPLAARVATILNVTEDHMDRYNGFEEYRQAKAVIYRQADYVVFNRDDAQTKTEEGQVKTSFGLSPNNDDFSVAEHRGQGYLMFDGEPLLAVKALKIKGKHNQANALAALALCQPFVSEWKPVLQALENFAGLKHRCQWVADVKGVGFYNDSKATNVGAAVAAVQGLATPKHRLFLIAGGQDKDSDFAPLADVVKPAVSRVFLIGQDANKLEAALGKDVCEHCETLEQAVESAGQLASAGDLVLFAPACASFDMFKNYEARGDAFIRAVEKLAA